MLSQKTSSETKLPSWHNISHSCQRPRHLHTSTLFDHYIITIGGWNDDGKVGTEEISVFDTITHQWKKSVITGFQPKHRYGHTACLYDTNKIIVFGGEINEQTTNEILILTMREGNRQDLFIHCEKVSASKDDLRRCYHIAEIFGDKMYVFGGVDHHDRASNETWSLDLNELKWTKCQQKGDIPSQRLRHKSTLIDNKMYIFGGRTNTEPFVRMNDLFALDLETLNWSEIKSTGTLPSPRNGMSLIAHQGLLYLFGGYTSKKEFSNELFSLNFKMDNKWKLIKTKNGPPSKRANSTMVPYENGAFIYGGGQDNTELNDLFYLSLPHPESQKKSCNHLKQMSQLCLNSLYSDVTFVIEDQKFFAHRMLLGTRCERFALMFASESNPKEIEIKDCSAVAFLALMRYIYCDEIDFTKELALELFILCNNWEFKELEEECEDFLIETLMLENVLERAQLANEFKAQRLIGAITEFIIENMNELEKIGDLSRMPPRINVKVMFELKRRVEVSQAAA